MSSIRSKQLAEARVEEYFAVERTHWNVFSHGLSRENWGGDRAQLARSDRESVAVRAERVLVRRGAISVSANLVV